jgi:colicin import membrane protein
VGSSAELWAAVPQAAAPAAVEPLVLPKPMPTPAVKAVEPPPPPRAETRDADIAVEKAKAEKLQRERAEIEQAKKLQQERAERQEREKAEKDKREKAERERREQEQIAKLRDEQLKRIQGQAGATGAPQSTGTAQREAGPSANYAGKIVARVRPNIVLTETVPPTLHAEVEVRIAPDGTITASDQIQRQRHLGRRGAARDRSHRDAAQGRQRPCAIVDDAGLHAGLGFGTRPIR